MKPPSVAGWFHFKNRWLFIFPLLMAYACMLAFSQRQIGLQLFPDPDDVMRLIQVRDWLAGQSWFDVTQYRMNAPQGGPMHWSRLVDVPIAAIIVLLRPFIGQATTETVALLLVPLITLAVVMVLVGVLGRKLTSPSAAFLAVVATPFSMAALTQLRPMRIDHHGWQLALGVTMAIAVLGGPPRRSAIVAGAAAATWLNISVEALPFTAAVGLWFGVQWLRDARSGDRLRYYTLAVAAVSILLFVLTRAPAAWAQPWCDSISAAHLAALTGAAAACAIAVRPTVHSWWLRGAILAGSGAIAAAALFATNGQCARDPFVALDPLVRRYWYDLVLEGLPLWRQTLPIALAVVTQPLIGLVGASVALRKSDGNGRARWAAYIYLLAAATLASVFVMRAGGLANVLSLVGTASLSAAVLRRAAAIHSAVPRILATTAGLGMMMPAYAVPLSFMKSPPRPSTAANTNGQPHVEQCMVPTEMRALRALPVGDIAAPLDISPAILLHTRHRVIASGHHRNQAAMLDVIRLFMLKPDDGRTIIAGRDIEYVVACPPMAEVRNYTRDRPWGLWGQLAAGKNPAWLEPLPVPGLNGLKVWRVRKDAVQRPSAPN